MQQVQQDDNYYDDYSSDNDEKAISGRSLSVVKEEDRYRYPYNCIGKILVLWERFNKKGQVIKLLGHGTGFLISSTEILTVAHNISCHGHNTNIENMRFKLFCQGNKMQNFKISQILFHDRFTKPLNSTDVYVYDFALLKLEEPIKRQKYLDIFIDLDKHFSKEDLKKMRLKLIGFPKDSQINAFEDISSDKQMLMTECSYEQAILTDQFKIYEYGCADHQLPSEQGHSGSPIIVTIQGKQVVVMLHKGGKNIGTAIVQIVTQSKINGQSIILKKQQQVNTNYGRIITSRLTELNGDILYNLLEWSERMNKNKSGQVFARNPSFSLFSLQKMRNHTFWDQKSLHFSEFQLKEKKIVYKSKKYRWGHLISKRKIYLENIVHIKDIILPKQGTIFFGFIHDDLKKTQKDCTFDIYQSKSISFMLTKSKNKIESKVSFNGRVSEKIENIDISKQLLIRLNFDKDPHVSKISRLQAKRYKQQKIQNFISIELSQGQQSCQNKQTHLIHFIDLSQPEDKFDVQHGYYFYVSMCRPGTSVYVDL